MIRFFRFRLVGCGVVEQRTYDENNKLVDIRKICLPTNVVSHRHLGLGVTRTRVHNRAVTGSGEIEV